MATSAKIILEFGCNHNGELSNAMKMVDEAARLGVWGIKLQKRNLDMLEYGSKYIPRKPENSFGDNYYTHRQALELSVEENKQIKEYAEKNGLQVVVTTFDTKSVEEMVGIGVKYVKLPSQLLSNYEMNRLLIKEKEKSGIQIICSTGMHTVSEILDWQYIKEFDIVMYCKSVYPAGIEHVNLINYQILSSSLNNCIGYSSHDEKGFAIPLLVILGAQYIERHYTLDKTMKGSDHATVSSDFKEMQNIIAEIESAEAMLGKPEINELKAEEEKKIKRRYRKI